MTEKPAVFVRRIDKVEKHFGVNAAGCPYFCVSVTMHDVSDEQKNQIEYACQNLFDLILSIEEDAAASTEAPAGIFP